MQPLSPPWPEPEPALAPPPPAGCWRLHLSRCGGVIVLTIIVHYIRITACYRANVLHRFFMQPTSNMHHTTTTLYLYPLLDRKRTRTFRKSIQVTFLPERRNVKCYTTEVAEDDNAKLTFTNEKITQRILYSCLINTTPRPRPLSPPPPPPQQMPTAP